jgi:hypothetical protein
VSTELLQIRDRHHENLLITDDGVIFNIDFGFCMGTTSKAVDNKFRLSAELISHFTPEDRAVFKETVHRYYTILRRHLNIFAPVLTHLGSAKPPIENYSKSVAETWKQKVHGRGGQEAHGVRDRQLHELPPRQRQRYPQHRQHDQGSQRNKTIKIKKSKKSKKKKKKKKESGRPSPSQPRP